MYIHSLIQTLESEYISANDARDILINIYYTGSCKKIGRLIENIKIQPS